MLSCLFVSNDDSSTYDIRFQLRGPQKATSEIILLEIRPEDFPSLFESRINPLISIHEVDDITDRVLWNEKLWQDLLTTLLHAEPKKIGITLFFGKNLKTTPITEEQRKIFQDPRIVWAQSTSSSDSRSKPLWTNSDESNVARNDFYKDEDGVVRKMVNLQNDFPHMIEKITDRHLTGTTTKTINYRGPRDTYTEYSMKEFLENRIPLEKLTGKIILIGTEAPSHTVLTPLGLSSKIELTAQIAENMLSRLWIRRAPHVIYFLGLFFLFIFNLTLLKAYPQTIAIILFVFEGMILAAFSAWIFDTYCFWVPVLAPWVMLVSNWIIISGYQSNETEKRNIYLEMESKNQTDLEILKNNFVSLISHDLKTPIAKIQSIVDRRLTGSLESETRRDFESLRTYGHELNRYIQSILKVMRVEAQDFRIHREICDLNQIILEALQVIEPLALEKKIRIEKSLEPLFTIEIDPQLIREVILNLVENAIKYSSDHTIIKIQSQELSDGVQFVIQDQGYGISEKELKAVWLKFARGQDQDLKTKGSGLGLYLVKFFVELHGGQVSAESVLGQGTKISFTIPTYAS